MRTYLASSSLVLGLALGLCWASAGFAEDRMALVIGNGRYPGLTRDKQLAKAPRDAQAVGSALESLGFSVFKAEDLDRRGMVDQIFDFTQKIKPGDLALFFYAGHGIGLSG